MKRLTESDLTLFNDIYDGVTGGKQKAINLDSSILVDQLYPNLVSLPGEKRFPVFLTIIGPNGAGPHKMTRKVLRQQKNWRLNGELISSPVDQPGRYSNLRTGDYALLEFVGDNVPKEINAYLLSSANEIEGVVAGKLDTLYGKDFGSRRGMVLVGKTEVERVLEEVPRDSNNPLLDLVDTEAVIDAAQQGFAGTRTLRQRRGQRPVDREELSRARDNAEAIGRQGEELIDFWLSEEVGKRGGSYTWDSNVNAISPFDFTHVGPDGRQCRIEVKSTAGGFDTTFHLSYSELWEASKGGVPYDIYRIYLLEDYSARLRVAHLPAAIAAEILHRADMIHDNFRVDSFSVTPEALQFGSEIALLIADEDEA